LHQHVHRGHVLARLGNSANTTGAHLHFQVTDRDSALQSQGVPFVLSSFTYLGDGATYEPDKHVTERQVNSMPPGNGVLQFDSPSGMQR
jgi:murein DD-endopeptidase MepM/ murein hydrolase activator NlpD